MLRLVRLAFRALGVLVGVAVVVIFVDASWERETLSLELRLRTPAEVASNTLAWATGQPADKRARPSRTRSAVSAGADQLTEEDRARLDELIEEKLRE